MLLFAGRTSNPEGFRDFRMRQNLSIATATQKTAAPTKIGAPGPAESLFPERSPIPISPKMKAASP